MKTDSTIIRFIDKIFLKKRGYVFKAPVKENVVFLMSGGLDSSISVAKVIQDWQAIVHPLFIKRYARAEKFEEKSFDYFVDLYTKRFKKNFKTPCKIRANIPPLEIKSDFSAQMLKTMGYPMRDASLQNIGVQYAVSLNEKYNLNIKTILTAMSPDETFPHCSIAAIRVQNLLACIDTEDWRWQIISPLIEPKLGRPLYKRDLILWALKNNIPLERTRTCISNKKIPDGTCPECLWRLAAFKDLDIADPLRYSASG